MLRGSLGSCLLEGKNLVRDRYNWNRSLCIKANTTKGLEGAAPGFNVAEANDGFMNIYEVGGIFME